MNILDLLVKKLEPLGITVSACSQTRRADCCFTEVNLKLTVTDIVAQQLLTTEERHNALTAPFTCLYGSEVDELKKRTDGFVLR